MANADSIDPRIREQVEPAMAPDLLFERPELAALYDLFAVPETRTDFAFYVPRIMAARSVLDVGCGTGALLRLARDRGHTGRLCGIDPAGGMLQQAAMRTDIEWVHADPATVSWEREFDLAIMTGHAFQALISDAALAATFRTIARSLSQQGRFVFETRNPAAREWERWDEAYSGRVTDASGTAYECLCRVHSVANDLVHFSHTFTSPAWDSAQVSESTLRFLDLADLQSLLAAAGLEASEVYGDWDCSPLSPNSPEIIISAGLAQGVQCG